MMLSSTRSAMSGSALRVAPFSGGSMMKVAPRAPLLVQAKKVCELTGVKRNKVSYMPDQSPAATVNPSGACGAGGATLTGTRPV